MLRKFTLLILCFSYLGLIAQNQVGINQPDIDASAVFEVASTEKGVLVPRMTNSNKNAIEDPTQGLIIYETSTNSFWYYNGAGWIKIGSNNSISDGIGDADSDTRIFLDYTSDNDQIRFFQDGTLHFRMNKERFDVLGTGNSVFIGDSAGYHDDMVSNFNTFIGGSAGLNVVSGRRQVGIGYQALRENTGDDDNIAIGDNVSIISVSARRITAIGPNILTKNIESDNHVAIGAFALENHTTNNHLFAIGIQALQNDISGVYNIGLGTRSLSSNVTSSTSIALGHEAGENVINKAGCIYLGYQAGADNSISTHMHIDNSDTSNPLMEGRFSSDRLDVNGKLHITEDITYVGDLTDISDRRLKKNIIPLKNVLPRLIQLNGYRYHLISRKEGTKEYGLIAQEVKEVFPTLARGVRPNSDILGVSYVQFIPLILQAENEQLEQIENLQDKIEAEQNELTELEKEIAQLKLQLLSRASR